jgi:hypothetical protein
MVVSHQYNLSTTQDFDFNPHTAGKSNLVCPRRAWRDRFHDDGSTGYEKPRVAGKRLHHHTQSRPAVVCCTTFTTMMQNLDIPIEGSGRAATGATRRRRIIFHKVVGCSIAPWTLKTNWCAPELSSCPSGSVHIQRSCHCRNKSGGQRHPLRTLCGGGATGMFLPKGAN